MSQRRGQSLTDCSRLNKEFSSSISSGFQVRANNANFKKHVLDAAKQIEDLLLAAGWHTVVENMEKHWVFEAAQGTLTWKYLQITQRELQSAQGLIQDKANRHAKELEERKTGPQQQRELLLKQLEEDKASRKDK
ncbi:MAG: hypothetical protein FRX49_03484 [Trebouxia sp. A1-2]|nr:MAG: hypothetical protein FRX49_03484 [Trebouxia sp. A1-2]